MNIRPIAACLTFIFFSYATVGHKIFNLPKDHSTDSLTELIAELKFASLLPGTALRTGEIIWLEQP